MRSSKVSIVIGCALEDCLVGHKAGSRHVDAPLEPSVQAEPRLAFLIRTRLDHCWVHVSFLELACVFAVDGCARDIELWVLAIRDSDPDLERVRQRIVLAQLGEEMRCMLTILAILSDGNRLPRWSQLRGTHVCGMILSMMAL